jgi:hypothetical protein
MNNTIESDRLFLALRKSWSTETARGDWREDVPSLNQCAVTALVVQDYLGGVLLRCLTEKGDSHYWNRLPSGKQVDLCKEQFKHIPDKPLLNTTIERDRVYVLSFPDTMARYQILSKRVRSHLP